MKYLLQTLAVAMMAAAAPANAADLLANGAFQGGSFANWRASGTVGLASSSYFNAPIGRDDGFVAVFNAGNAAPTGALEQTIASTEQTTYDLAFDYSVTSGGAQSINASVLDGVTRAVLATGTMSATSNIARRHTLSFVALSGSTVIRFTDVAANNSIDQDGGLSRVSVEAAVPEPATWAMMMLGFAGLGAAMRRRPNIAAAPLPVRAAADAAKSFKSRPSMERRDLISAP